MTPRRSRRLLTNSGFEVSTASDLSQGQMREAVSDFAGKVASKGADTDRAGVLRRPWRADRRREFSGSGRHRSEAGSRHSDPGGAAQRHPEHADVGAEQDAHPDARRLPQQSVPGSSRAPAAGLRSSMPRSALPSTFLSFSTSPGAVAEDGTGSNSPYTNALLAAGKEPNIPIEETFKRVRACGQQGRPTGGRRPWDSSSLTEDFRFSGTAVAGPKPAAAPRRRSRSGRAI